MKRKAIALVIVAGIVAASGWALGRERSEAPAAALTLSGTIEVTDAEVSFRIPGRVEARLVSEGETVTANTVVARLDATELRQEIALREAELRGAEADLAELRAGTRPEEIAQAEAALARAHAEAARAGAEHGRQRGLFEQDVIAARELESAEAAHAVAVAGVRQTEERLALLRNGPRAEQIAQLRARVDRARQALEVARTREAYTTVVAPLSGVILAEHVEPGEQVGAGTPVVTIGDLERVWLRGYMDEADLGRVHLGQDVQVTTDTYPGKVYAGRVSFIASDAEFTPKTVQTQKERVKLVYRVKVAIPNPSMELKPGMPADARIVLGAVGASSR